MRTLSLLPTSVMGLFYIFLRRNYIPVIFTYDFNYQNCRLQSSTELRLEYLSSIITGQTEMTWISLSTRASNFNSLNEHENWKFPLTCSSVR